MLNSAATAVLGNLQPSFTRLSAAVARFRGMQALAPATSLAARTRPMSGRVLVVDDDPSWRQAIVRALELEGYDVTSAEDGAQALSCFDEDATTPDVVVLDV